MRTGGWGRTLRIELLAEHGQWAFSAFWISCGAAITPKKDDTVAEITALFRGQDFSQLLFYLFGVFSG